MPWDGHDVVLLSLWTRRRRTKAVGYLEHCVGRAAVSLFKLEPSIPARLFVDVVSSDSSLKYACFCWC
jgi:hypothetical protein